MIRTQRSDSNRQISGINITPFTDIVLVLLIIFMVAVPSMTADVNKGFLFPLPKASVNASLPTTPVIVYIRADGTMKLNDTSVTFSTLGPQLLQEIAARQGQVVTMVIRAEKTVPYQVIITAIDIARNNGINQIGFGTEPNETAAPGG
jgi:biopolymer transport protein ExbD